MKVEFLNRDGREMRRSPHESTRIQLPMSPLISLTDAAAYLGMTANGLRKIVRGGGITYFQHGRRGRIKFRPEWLDEFVGVHTHPPRQFVPRPSRQPKQKPSKPAGKWDHLGFRDDLYKRYAK